MSIATLEKYNIEKKNLHDKLSKLESENWKIKNLLGDMMPAYLKQRIIGYRRDEIELKDMHKYLQEYELKDFDIETYDGAGSSDYVNKDTVRKSVIASVQKKEYVGIGNMNNSSFSIYKEDDYVKIFHRGMHFYSRHDKYTGNHVELLEYKQGDKYAKVLVKVLWCNKFKHHTFMVNVEKFNKFYEENKHNETFIEEELSEENLKLLLKPAIKSKAKPEVIAEDEGTVLPEPKVKVPDWLMFGKKYRVKSKKWFDKNKNEHNSVVQGEAIFSEWHLCGKSLTIIDFCENLYKHEHDVEVSLDDSNGREKYIAMFALEEDPSDKRKPSAEILKLVQSIKKHKFLFAKRDATGAGRGRLISMKSVHVKIGFDKKGVECLKIPSSHSFMYSTWTIDQIRELVKNKKVEKSYSISQCSGVCETIIIGNERKKMPQEFQWKSY